jgi:hypothetical protein
MAAEPIGSKLTPNLTNKQIVVEFFRLAMLEGRLA